MRCADASVRLGDHAEAEAEAEAAQAVWRLDRGA